MKTTPRMLVLAALFVTCLITANIVGVKWTAIGGFALPAAVIVFPFSYIFGDVLTEVYGYRWARRIIWLGFLCNLLFVIVAWLGGLLPPAPFWTDNQSAYQTILGFTPRLLLGSFGGYVVGELTNSLILSRLKLATRGRFLWVRTISSTIVGEGLDTAVFQVLAFAGTPYFTPIFILYHWLAKVGIEVVATPLTYRAVNYLKRREGVDTYDDKINFNPFSF
jgi:queuosine precursor transporter